MTDRELDLFCAFNVFKSALVRKASPRRWEVRYHMDELPPRGSLEGGVGCGGFKNEKEALDYLWSHVKHPSTNPADAMLLLQACIKRLSGDAENISLTMAICLFAHSLYSNPKSTQPADEQHNPTGHD